VIEDEFLPTYDVSDTVAVVVEADPERTWSALLDVDLVELGRRRPLIGMLGALRVLPELIGRLLRGERPARPPKRVTLRDMTAVPLNGGGWVLLAERPPEHIALGGATGRSASGRARARAGTRPDRGCTRGG
jgi:hypothetical protein